MRKRIFLIGLVMMASVSVPLEVFATGSFSDVTQTHPHAIAIQALKDAQVVSGYPDGTFKPDRPISRAEAAALILKAAGITVVKSKIRVPFLDVSNSAWFFPAIQKGIEMKKLRGFPDGTFRPLSPITFSQALVLTLSFFQVNTNTIIPDPIIYSGLDPHDWYAKPAQYAKNFNIIEPDAAGRINPNSEITRGELAEMIYRMRSVKNSGAPFDITRGWVATEYFVNFWKIKRPADWEIFQGTANSVIWKRAPDQAFFTRIMPTSAQLSISVTDNQDFTVVKNNYEKMYVPFKPKFSQVKLSGKSALRISLPDRHIEDLVISLPNNKSLVVYGQYGEAPEAQFLRQQLIAMEASYEYGEKAPESLIPLADRLSILREHILLKRKSAEALKLFPDKKLIQTDAIGIGTGPVDYYASKEAGYTIKLERNSQTILNIREGETSSF